MLVNMCGKIVCLSWVCVESSKDTGPSPTSLERWREESSLEALGSSHPVFSFLLEHYRSHSLTPHTNWQPHVTLLIMSPLLGDFRFPAYNLTSNSLFYLHIICKYQCITSPACMTKLSLFLITYNLEYI